MLFKRETKIDKLARQKKELMIKREKMQRDMRERNSKRENKISALENASQEDFENTSKKVVELTRQIEKKVRELDSEQIYVTQVAESEKREHLEAKLQETAKKTFKGAR